MGSRKTAATAAPDTEWIFSTWPDAAGACRRVGLTRFQFRTLERKGTFRYRDCLTTGRRVYDPIALTQWKLENPTKASTPKIRAYKKAIEGAASAKAFLMFDAGTALREIVKTCSLSPDQVYELREHYVSMGSDVILSDAAVKELRQVLPTWNGKTEDGLTGAITKRIREAYEQQEGATDDDDNKQGAAGRRTPATDAGSLASHLQRETGRPVGKSDSGTTALRIVDGRRKNMVGKTDHGASADHGAARVAKSRRRGRKQPARSKRGAGNATGSQLDPSELRELGNQ